MRPHRALRFAAENKARFLAELKQFLRYPSVSSQPDRRSDARRCATWLARHLSSIGMPRVRVVPTRGNPIVFASKFRSGSYPTILFYGHYDVLPGEPQREWRTPPFEPTIVGNKLFARGASDDKGQLFIHIKAVESYLAAEGGMPANVKFLFEGEEEIGSPNLASFIERNRKALEADAAVISDTRMSAPNRPAISYAQRGGLRIELEVAGSAHDLHSGNFGGAVLNPAQALCEMIAKLHDEHGRITIPGFYADVRNWGGTELAFMARNGRRDEEILGSAGVDSGWGERGFTAYERTTIRPALTINGLTSGHQGTGAKSILPSRAIAKLSFRLVPDQRPKRVAALFRDYIKKITPRQVRSHVRAYSPIAPAILDRKHPAILAAVGAYEESFGARPAFIRSGGSIPVVSTFQKQLGVPVVLMGFGLPEDNIHAPNENIDLTNFAKGIETSIWYLASVKDRLHTRDRRAISTGLPSLHPGY
jgi:acetylornithine deacetylase/succinyl-diaminopimelate desuccinylase-like protein